MKNDNSAPTTNKKDHPLARLYRKAAGNGVTLHSEKDTDKHFKERGKNTNTGQQSK